MKSIIAVALLAVALVLSTSRALTRAQVDCEATRCAAQATIDRRCSCAQAATHGAYVRCVAQEVRELAGNGTIPQSCKGPIKRCAARSACGRPAGAVTCEIPVVSGTCAIGLGFCQHPDGSILYTHPCSSDADCVIESRCRISASAERCAALGGTVTLRPSCCAECGPSPGTPCGPGLTCSASEICVIFGPFGPGGFSQTCHPVPAGCDLNRTCGCVSPVLCSPPHVCHDSDAPGDVIFCECTSCV